MRDILKKVEDLTLGNKLTSGLIFNPNEIVKDPHEVMAEQLNISSEKAAKYPVSA